MNYTRGSTACRYDRETETYLVDGEPCRIDEYGDPTRHCTARRTCSQHVGPSELTCARCIGRVRADIRMIVDRAAMMLPEAMESGIHSEAANLAGPSADPEAWRWHQLARRRSVYAIHWSDDTALEKALRDLPDDDDLDPSALLGRWVLMLAEDYGLTLPPTLDLATSAGSLDRILGRVAQDPEQDFRLLGREVRRCRTHMEAALRDGQAPERGAPCPDCQEPAPRMIREYGHWCDDDDCTRFHYSVVLDGTTGMLKPDTSGDRWLCPRDSTHWRTHTDYEAYVEQRKATRTG